MSYGYEVINNNKSYDIGLFKRHYFLRKKITDIVTNITSYTDAQKLSKMLDVALKTGIDIAKKKKITN